MDDWIKSIQVDRTGLPGGLSGKKKKKNAHTHTHPQKFHLPMQKTQAGGAGLILGSRRSPGEGNATHSSILAGKISWTEESGMLQSMESEDSDMT